MERTEGEAWWRGFAAVEMEMVGGGSDGKDETREVKRARVVASGGHPLSVVCKCCRGCAADIVEIS